MNTHHDDVTQPALLSEATAQVILTRLFPGSVLTAITSLTGSTSNATSLVTARLGNGTAAAVVMRRYKIFYHYDRGEKARREYRLFELLYHSDVPVPEPLLLDDTGALLGSPGIVTRYVPSVLDLTPANPTAWAHEMASTLAKIHRISGTAFDTGFLLDAHTEALWFFYPNKGIPPYMAVHSQGVEVWAAMQRLLPTLHTVAPSLVHLDYWSGQVLWQNGRIVAVVDWEEVAYGEPAIDVAYCRMDMILSGKAEAADEFLRVYEATTGGPVSNLGFWELAAAVRPMFQPEGWIDESPARERFVAFVNGALRRSSI
ncbi:MAG: phosphotransferase [Chloroflexota bacterium]|nr:phosphotransferase [Chloroflexota bacterium]